ncbi:MAG: hypothetical protein ACP5N7_04610 [Candidatus Pacearchaeota archaeon]
MITYELALKLKEAGFPQVYKKTEPWMDFSYNDVEELHMLHYDNDTGWWIGNDYQHREMTDEQMQKDWVKCPTLSELIEACVELNHEMTFHLENTKDNVQWWAEMRHFGTLVKQVKGFTPEESVANLWLALQG